MRASWVKLRSLTIADYYLAFQAMMGIPLIIQGLHILGVKRLKKVLANTIIQCPGKPEYSTQMAHRAAQMANAVSIRFPLHVTCLQRSMTLWWMLYSRGIESTVVIGVRKQQQMFHAHAWVELEGEAINDRSDIRSEFLTVDLI